MRHYAGLFAAINEGKRSVELDLKDTDGPRPGARAGGPGRRGGGGIPSRGAGAAGTGRSGRAGSQSRCRLLLHLRLRADGPACPAAGPRRELPGLVRGPDARRRLGHEAPAAPDGRPRRRADRGLRDLRRRPGSDHDRRRGLPRRLHDRRAGDVDRTRRCQRRPIRRPIAGTSPATGAALPHARVRPLRHGRRRAGGARCPQRAALLGEPVPGARPRRRWRSSTSTSGAAAAWRSRTP